MEQSEHIQLTLNYLMDTWNNLVNCLLKNPDKLAQNQMNYWQDYISLYQNLATHPEDIFDKRFQHKDWQENMMFDFIKRSYLLLSKHVGNAINDVVANEDPDIARQLRFMTRQFIDASAPTNFINTNPEILSKIMETSGANLLSGYQNFMKDIESGKGMFSIKLTKPDSFKLGQDIACTPGHVVYQNDVMQLIQYTATTEQTYEIPILIMPPWINKYYILDLQQENSLVKWLVDQGFTVFMISWVNASSELREKEFSDYMLEAPIAALKVIEKISGSKTTNVLGYCIGGTLLGCTLAYLADKNPSQINSATFITTLLDFSEPGELGTFTNAKQIPIIESMMKEKGYLDGNIMAAIFNALRANDMIWSSFVNQYLKGQNPKPFDLLFWNSDATNIPEYVHSYYLNNMYLYNNLVKSGKMQLANTPIDLKNIKTPSYFLAAEDDHIVPWTSSYMGKQYLSGLTKFVLTKSGHVGGVINPPHRKKYGYWTNSTDTNNSEQFLANAKFNEGSWWTDWENWLKEYSGKKHGIENLNLTARKEIEKAPGSYVKVRLMDIAADEFLTKKEKEKV